MRASDSVAQIGAALAAAQAEIKTVVKDRTNPHFKNRYATLDAIMETVRPVLAKHGLSIVQGCTIPSEVDGRLVAFAVETMVLHASGEFLSNMVYMPLAKQSAQDAGSALTYGRRYGVSALLSLATDDDDDGEQASGNQRQASNQRPAAASAARTTDASDKQKAFLAKLSKSSVLSEKEATLLRRVTDRDKAKEAIDWATRTIAERETAGEKGEGVNQEAAA
jgi:hypothetical protein